MDKETPPASCPRPSHRLSPVTLTSTQAARVSSLHHVANERSFQSLSLFTLHSFPLSLTHTLSQTPAVLSRSRSAVDRGWEAFQSPDAAATGKLASVFGYVHIIQKGSDTV